MGLKHDNLVLQKTKLCREPITMMNHIIAILTTICQHLPIGTHLGMVHFQWMWISDALLPNRGAIVRPLGRIRKGKLLEASLPDETYLLTTNGRELRVEIWRNLVRADQKPSPKNETFDIYVFHDPQSMTPWVLATPLKLKPESVHQIYADRWPVEQVPLSSKQMLGAHRQFVHNPECVQRLPEITLLAGSILSFLAASFPPVPTGF